MNSNNLIKKLKETKDYRSTIYFNEKEINSLYSQRSEGISKIIKSSQIGGNIEGSLGEFFSSFLLKIVGTIIRSSTSEIDLNNIIIRARLIEHYLSSKKELIDLNKISDPTTLRPKDFLIYTGGANIYSNKETELISKYSNDNFIIDNFDLIKKIREEREDDKDTNALSTIVLTATTTHLKLVSIASTKWIDLKDGNFPRYIRIPPFGIFGKYEQKIDDLLFIQPLWIWKENQ